jgi:steroid 5-alpha reductase family enzyme
MSGNTIAWLALPAIVAVAVLVGLAGSDGSVEVGDIPLFLLCGVVAFAIQWAVFVPSWIGRTEMFFDLTGSATYLTVVILALLLNEDADARAVLVAVLVAVWALRLGTFLFGRVRAAGFDRRFDDLKQSFPRFLMTWTLQGLWAFLTLAAGLAAMTSADREDIGVFAIVGAALWAVGFAIEVTADRQKSAFRADDANADRFISSGLWAWSRHPNYFGEIVLWTGVTLIALPVLSGWQWVTLISPFFVTLLLTRVSGIPLLEARARNTWGDEPEYQAYVERTPVLIPRPPRS